LVTYSYRALTADGTETRGIVQAMDEFQAAARIKEKCPVITSIVPVKAGSKHRLLNMEIGSKKVRTKSLALMCSQFAITLKSGMPVGRAMEMIARQTDDKKLKKILISAAEDVNAGVTVASSFEKFKDAFPVTFIESIRAGEQSGTLDHSFTKMGEYYEKTYKTAEKVKSTLTYPIFVICIAIVVLIVVMTKVIPALAETFASLGGQLPLATRALISFSDFFARWWIVMVILILAAVLAWKAFVRTESGRKLRARLQLSLPVIGKINTLNGAAQFANTMAMMISAGLTLDNAVEITAKVMDNYLLHKDVESMIGRIIEGRPLGECIRKSEYFPDTLKEMCAVGEESGELDATLTTIGDYFTNEVDNAIKTAIARLEPTILVFLAIFAGFIVFSIYLPMFTMYDLM
jgi:type IV pilus assembly protein PilC